MKVLIVDDNPDNLYLLEMLLKGHGYEVLMAGNGAEALDLLRTEGVELIISDILMPVMDGFQLCREVRADSKLCDSLFVFYTATYTSEEDEEFALGLGADRFIVKPAEPDTFMAIIAEVLQRAKNGSIDYGAATMDKDDYLAAYSMRLKEKLEDKMAEVRESERRYRNLFNSLRDVVIVADLAGKLIDANQPALRNTFGYELDDVKGKDCSVLSANYYGLFDTPASADGNPVDANFRTSDGSVFQGELSVQKLIDDDGAPVGNIGVIRDVSRQKLLEVQLLHAQKMEAVGRLAGGVAHDFNNKLTAIIGFVDLLKRGKPPWDVVEERLDQIARAAEHSSDITRQLLAFSRKEIITPRRINLNNLIENGCKALGRLIGEDIKLEFLLSPDLWYSRLDATQVDQIIMNLAVNARDAMPNGGRLSFETRNVRLDDGFCPDSPDAKPGEYVRLCVADTGCGIDDATVKHIFEPFFTTKETGKGTGLGLSTVYGIVTQNGGFINVRSKVDHGTAFTIFFPRYEGEEASECADETPLAGSCSGNILLVEDDDSVRLVTRQMLESLGYRVIDKAGPEEAVTYCASDDAPLELILADVVMPGMSAREMAERIRRYKPDTPLLYMTGYSAEMTVARGVLEDGAHLLRKPFDTKILKAKILSVLMQDRRGR